MTEIVFRILTSDLLINVQTTAAALAEILGEALGRVFKNTYGLALGTASVKNFKNRPMAWTSTATNFGPTIPDRNKILSRLLRVISNIQLVVGDNTQVDIFGDTHQFLMNMYPFQAD